MDGVDLSSIMVQAPSQNEPASPAIPEASPVSSQREPPKAEPTTDRTTTLTKMKLYFDCFEAKLKQIRPKDIDKLTDEELQDLQTKIHFILGAKTNVEAMTKTLPMILKALEDLSAQFTPLRIQGTHLVCLEPDIQDMIKYTIIDSGLGGITSSPQQRLAFTLLTTAVRQHAINSAIESMSPDQRRHLQNATQSDGAVPSSVRCHGDVTTVKTPEPPVRSVASDTTKPRIFDPS